MNLKSYPKPSLFDKRGVKYGVAPSVTPDKGYGDSKRAKNLAMSKSTNEPRALGDRTSSLKSLKQTSYKFSKRNYSQEDISKSRNKTPEERQISTRTSKK